MDLCNAARLPDEFNKNEALVSDIQYEGKRCLILNDVDVHGFNEAVATHLSTQILIVHGYKAKQLPTQLERLNNLHMFLLSASHVCSVPSILCSLVNLSLLDLSDNQIKELPDSWASLVNLKVLDLSKNMLNHLPESIYSLGQLQSLDLSENKFSEISPQINKLKGLQILSCSFNNISALPNEITCLINLLVLRLMNNKLCYLPRSFPNLSSLLILQLDCNIFDHFPYQIFQCSSLIELSLSDNNIEGPLPPEFGNLTNLRNLNVANNVCNELTRTIGNLKQLEYINFSGNRCKAITFSLTCLQKIEELSFSACELTSLPDEIGLLKQLVILNLSMNRLSHFPETVDGFPRLTALLLASNNFSLLPEWICLLENLVVLELQQNKLSVLPKEFHRLYRTLRQINLSNNLFATFPTSLCHTKSCLTYLCMESNPLKEIPEEISCLKNMTHLSLTNCSSLTTLPNGLGYCTNLRVLRLNQCLLESLPNSFAELISLKYLDLSDNNFGIFPIVVCYLPKLKVLLYDQHKGKPLVTQDDPKGWYNRSEILYPKTPTLHRNEPESSKLSQSDYGYPSLEEALNMEQKLDSGLPALIGKLSQLTHFSLQSNGLFMLPDVFHTMNLRRLNLSHNRLYYLPARFHKSRSITHLYLHNNQIQRLDDNFQQLKSLRILTLADNPLICPPVDVCSDRKVLPVFHYLRQRKRYENALLQSMCEVVLTLLPKESADQFLIKLGFPESVIDVLEQEYPGGYNFSRRLRIALEAWSGLHFNDGDRASTGSGMLAVVPSDHSHGTDFNQRSAEDFDAQSSPSKPPHTPGSGQTTEGTPGTPVERHLSQVDAKSIPTRESQSVHSFGINSSPVGGGPTNVTFLLKEAVAGADVSPMRLVHLVHLLGLDELHTALVQLEHKAHQFRF